MIEQIGIAGEAVLSVLHMHCVRVWLTYLLVRSRSRTMGAIDSIRGSFHFNDYYYTTLKL